MSKPEISFLRTHFLTGKAKALLFPPLVRGEGEGEVARHARRHTPVFEEEKSWYDQQSFLKSWPLRLPNPLPGQGEGVRNDASIYKTSGGR